MNGRRVESVFAVLGGLALGCSHAAPVPPEQTSTVAEPLSSLARAPTVRRSAQLAAAFQQSCVVTPTGNVRCWGEDSNGQNARNPASDVLPGVSNVVAVAVGYQMACALLQSGGVQCWGNNGNGQLGNGTTQPQSGPVGVLYASGATVSDAIAVAAGGEEACLLNAAGNVYCWGYNGLGEVGNGTVSAAQTTAAQASLSGSAVDVAVGADHACALLADGTVSCWGMGTQGQLGNGYSQQNTPVQVSGLSGAKAIAAGGYHTCALMADTSIRCWGYGPYGELGNGSAATTATPQTVSRVNDDGTTGPMKGVVQISGGVYSTCAVTGDGRGWCWGYNSNGQLGNTTWDAGGPSQPNQNQTVASPVGGAYVDNGNAREGLDGLIAMAAGYQHACGLKLDGTVWCFGANSAGQLGVSGIQSSTIPVQVQGAGFAMTPPSIAAGYQHTCIVMADGSGRCWGGNVDGNVGDGTQTNRSTPVPVLGSARWRTVAAGSYHTCALTADGAVLCWGYNNSGQLGDGTTTNRSSPVLASVSPGGLLGGVTGLAAGEQNTCAAMSDGTVECWGWGGEGGLGDGNTTPHFSVSPRPVQIAPVDGGASQNLTGVVALTSGNAHMCALLQSGTVWCWGRNTDGELGNGTTASNGYAVQASGLTGTASIGSGEYHTCAVDSAGTVRCWGLNQSGQIGDGTTTNRLSPTPVSPALPAGTVSIVGGWSHTCTLRFDGTVTCWGSDANGQIGQPGSGNYLNPSNVAGIGSPPISLAAGDWHTCAVGIDGTVWCWGDNMGGDLGNGVGTTNTSTPTKVQLSPGGVAFNRSSTACMHDYGGCSQASDCCGGRCLNGVCLRSDQCASTPYPGFGANVAVQTLASSSSSVQPFLTFDFEVDPSANFTPWAFVWGSHYPIQENNSSDGGTGRSFYETFQRADVGSTTCPQDGWGAPNIYCFDPSGDCTSTGGGDAGAGTCNVCQCVPPDVGRIMDTVLGTTTWSSGSTMCPVDWVLRTKDGCPTTIDGASALVTLDISNPVVRAYQLASLRRSLKQNPYSAVAIDNFYLENILNSVPAGSLSSPAAGHYLPGTTQMVMRYHPDVYGTADPQFAVDAVSWLQYMRAGLDVAGLGPDGGSNAGTALYANFGGNPVASKPWVEQVLSSVDGLVDEGSFAYHHTLGSMSQDDWLQKVQFMEEMQRHSAAYLGIDEYQNSLQPADCNGGPPACTYATWCSNQLDGTSGTLGGAQTSAAAQASMEWGLASYLIGKEQSAYIYSTMLTNANQYGCANLSPEYTTASGLGAPCASAACLQRVGGAAGTSPSAFVRTFTHGLAIVNPSGTPISVPLTSGRTFTDLYGATYSGTFSIGAYSGVVLSATGAGQVCP